MRKSKNRFLLSLPFIISAILIFVNILFVKKLSLILVLSFLSLIFILIGIAYIVAPILAKLEKDTYELGICQKAKIVGVKPIYIERQLPKLSSNKWEKYNNKEVNLLGRYVLIIEFINDKDKVKIKKMYANPVNRHQLSYLIKQQYVEVKVYKNNCVLIEEIKKDVDKSNIELITYKNDSVEICDYYFMLANSVKYSDNQRFNVNEYSLKVRKKRSKTTKEYLKDEYDYVVEFNYYNEENQVEKIMLMCIEVNFYSIQLLQQHNLPLPVILLNKKIIIDRDRLPLV